MATEVSKQTKTSSLAKASEIVSKGANAITDGANTITKLSEKLDQMDRIFIEAGLSPNAQRMVDMYIQRLEKDNLTPAEEMKIQELIHLIVMDDIEGRTRKAEARAKLNRSQGVKTAGYGIGIGFAVWGTGKLIKTIHDIHDKRNNNNKNNNNNNNTPS